MLGPRAVTCAAGNAELSDLSIRRSRLEIEIRLRFYVMTKNAVGVPLSDVLFEIASVWKKERSVQADPSVLCEVVGNGQSVILAVLFGDILLDTARSDSAFDLIGFPLAVRIGKRHEKRVSAPFHLSFDAEIFVFIILFEIALNRLRRDVLRHSAVEGSPPRREMIGVTGETVLRIDIVLIGLALTRPGKTRSQAVDCRTDAKKHEQRNDDGFRQNSLLHRGLFGWIGGFRRLQANFQDPTLRCLFYLENMAVIRDGFTLV